MAESENISQKELMMNAGIAAGILIPLFFCCSFWTFVFYIGLIRLAGNVSFMYQAVKEYYLTKRLDLTKRYGKGSYALITGGANGIGLEYAKQLSKLDFNVAIIDYNQEALDKAKEEIISGKDGVDVIAIQTDITKCRDQEAFEKLIEPLKDLDISILVNNVGAASCLPFNEASQKMISSIVDLNVGSVVAFSSLFYTRLTERAKEKKLKSAIITMASSSSFYPVPSFFMYSATKGFASFFTRALNNEGNPKVDHLNVCPGFVSTYMTGFRKDNVTITPDICVQNALRALGNFETTEVALPVKLMVAGLLQSFWYLDRDIFKKALAFLGATEANKKAFAVVSKREREENKK